LKGEERGEGRYGDWRRTDEGDPDSWWPLCAL
jgi:hypothetical protein